MSVEVVAEEGKVQEVVVHASEVEVQVVAIGGCIPQGELGTMQHRTKASQELEAARLSSETLSTNSSFVHVKRQIGSWGKYVTSNS